MVIDTLRVCRSSNGSPSDSLSLSLCISLAAILGRYVSLRMTGKGCPLPRVDAISSPSLSVSCSLMYLLPLSPQWLSLSVPPYMILYTVHCTVTSPLAPTGAGWAGKRQWFEFTLRLDRGS